MEKLFAFIAQQWMLVGAWLAAVAMLVWHEARKAGKSLSPSAVSQLVNRESAVLLDVRDSAEFRKGYITDAINIPLAQLSGRLGELEKHKEHPIIVICKFGQSAGTAAKVLRAAGFTNVARLGGGLAEWQAQQLPLVKK